MAAIAVDALGAANVTGVTMPSPYSSAGTRRDAGVSVAEVNLKLIWDVVSQITVGERGHAYVVDAQGRLIGICGGRSGGTA